jgi:hypothetical protein
MTDIRRQLANLLILTAFGMAVGRILAAELVLEPSLHRGPDETNPTKRAWPATRPNPMPTFSSNDRARWATVRALVEKGTFVVGERNPEVVWAGVVGPLCSTNTLETLASLQAGYSLRTDKKNDTGIVFEDGWGTVDKVLHPSRLKYYSTKPPLLSVLVAGEYWLVNRLTGWTLEKEPTYVVPLILLTINALPLLLYLGLLFRLLEQHVCAAFGTLVTPFLITFNNHTVGTFSAMVALYAVCRIWERERAGSVSDGKANAWLYLLAGLTAGFTATCDLPALSLAACLGLVLAWQQGANAPRSPHPWGRLSLYAFGVLVPLVAQGVLNVAVLGVEDLKPEASPYEKAKFVVKRGLGGAYAEFGGPWYKYEGSHWAREPLPGQKRRGIDFAREHETQATYALHLLVGHHGVFSLTPFTLLTVAGVVLGLLRPDRAGAKDVPVPADEPGSTGGNPLPRFFFVLSAVLSVVVVGFYIYQSENYGGWTAGPRWLMWLLPLWLLTMLPAVDALSRRRWGRALAGVLLVLSVLSASYPAWNPWRHPWIYRWFDSQGWIPY